MAGTQFALPRRARASLVSAALVCIVCVPSMFAAFEAGVCDQQGIEFTKTAVMDGNSALRNVRVTDLEAYDDLPIAVQSQMAVEKQAVQRFVRALMSCTEAAHFDRAAVETTLRAALLKRKGEMGEHFGLAGFNVRLGAKLPHLLTIQAQFSIPCGDDNMLFGFVLEKGRWREVLDWWSGPYQHISGAYGDVFEYAVSPPDPAGRFYVLAAHGSPWCTSRFSGLEYQVIEPALDGNPQRVLFAKNSSYNRTAEAPVLTAESHRFGVRFPAFILDLDLYGRTHLEYYEFSNGAHRVQPVAITPRDFVDEWLQSKWEEARDWSVTADGLRAQHDKLSKALDSGTGQLLHYGFIHRCKSSSREYQVDVRIGGSNYSFQVQKRSGRFMMLKVGPLR